MPETLTSWNNCLQAWVTLHYQIKSTTLLASGIDREFHELMPSYPVSTTPQEAYKQFSYKGLKVGIGAESVCMHSEYFYYFPDWKSAHSYITSRQQIKKSPKKANTSL